MADRTIYLQDKNTMEVLPIKLDDNGDGTYSLGTSLIGALPAGTAALGSLTAGEAHIGAVGGHSEILDVTLSLDTNIYASGDVLAATQAITNAVRVSGGTAIVTMVEVFDDDDQGGALDILFFRSNVDIGTENAAYAITDAEMIERCGWVRVIGTDYEDWGDQRSATLKMNDAGFKASILKPTTGTSIYVAAISRDAKTYSASGIKLKIHVLQD